MDTKKAKWMARKHAEFKDAVVRRLMRALPHSPAHPRKRSQIVALVEENEGFLSKAFGRMWLPGDSDDRNKIIDALVQMWHARHPSPKHKVVERIPTTEENLEKARKRREESMAGKARVKTWGRLKRGRARAQLGAKHAAERFVDEVKSKAEANGDVV